MTFSPLHSRFDSSLGLMQPAAATASLIATVPLVFRGAVRLIEHWVDKQEEKKDEVKPWQVRKLEDYWQIKLTTINLTHEESLPSALILIPTADWNGAVYYGLLSGTTFSAITKVRKVYLKAIASRAEMEEAIRSNSSEQPIRTLLCFGHGNSELIRFGRGSCGTYSKNALHERVFRGIDKTAGRIHLQACSAGNIARSIAMETGIVTSGCIDDSISEIKIQTCPLHDIDIFEISKSGKDLNAIFQCDGTRVAPCTIDSSRSLLGPNTSDFFRNSPL